MADSQKQEPEHRDQVMVPMGRWMEIIGKSIAEEAAAAAVREHRDQCDFNKLKNEFWDTAGRPGLKTIVDRHETRIGNLEKCRLGVIAFVRDKLTAPIVAAIITAAIIGWMNQRSDEPEERPPDRQAQDDGSRPG